MKKKYVRPESRLFVINLAENIAGSAIGDMIDGTSVIRFIVGDGNCRAYYSNDYTAPVRKGPNAGFLDYLLDIALYSAEGNQNVIQNCYGA